MNPLLYTDYYKTEHHNMYPKGTTMIYSNFTPRKSRIPGVDKVVVFGVQHFIIKYLLDKFVNNFFKRPLDEVIKEYTTHINVDATHIVNLHKLGYLPIEIKALPEGTLCPIGVPVMTIKNTHPDFFWLTNYLETLISCQLWQPITSATIAYEYKKLLEHYAKETTGSTDFVPWQGHDFSMRGMSSIESAILSGMGHLLSFTGTDTIPAIYALEKSYAGAGLIGASVPATEHSVMCMGTKDDEIGTFKTLMDKYPKGILSVVSDTWDLWKVCTEYLPKLKEEILARDGKLVIRPDSGNPVDIICGLNKIEDITTLLDLPSDEYVYKNTRFYFNQKEWLDVLSYYDKEIHLEEALHTYLKNDNLGGFKKWNGNKVIYFLEYNESVSKGVIELLWDIFGGTINEKGYKVLDPHIGAIYGDSITLERAKEICERLKAKGFASTNIVLGIGSYTYQYNTRDTFGFAMKATAGKIGDEMREIFKDPITDDGTKKSKKGLLKVTEVALLVPDTGEKTVPIKTTLVVKDQCNWNEEKRGLLETVFLNGELTKAQTLKEIRERLNKQ